MIPPELADAPYAIRYAWCAVRGLPLPEAPTQEEKLPRGRPRKTSWNSADDALVRAQYVTRCNDGTLPQFAAMLSRTPLAVQTRAARLGLTGHVRKSDV